MIRGLLHARDTLRARAEKAEHALKAATMRADKAEATLSDLAAAAKEFHILRG